ncbi:MAG: PEP-CTERM sorting domain-containing protein [Planctomycetes bacterium]|nr:PEP-CTERM sorting domain-containing protein [Planctomycetota bacterium]
MATKHSLAIAVSLVLAAATSAHAGAEIKLVGDPDQELYDPAQPITVSIFANMTEQPINDPVLLRGIQFDFNATDPQIGLPASMDFVNPMGLYAEFENLPIPATLWPLPSPLPAGMIELILGEDVLLGTVDITAQDELGTTRTLDVLNAGGSLKFGFGIDKDDPITDWRGSNGDLTGGTLDIVTVPEPATIGLLLVAVVAMRRRRMVGSL